MKKILLFILLTFLTVSGFSQGFTKFKRNRITVDTLINNYYFIYRGDTIEFDQLSTVQFSADSVSWHIQKAASDIYFRLKTSTESYYRQQKIWDGRTLDLDTFRIINVDTAINALDAVNYVLLKDSIAALRGYTGTFKLNSDSTANDGYVSNYALIDTLTKYSEITTLTDSLDLIRDTLAVHNTRIIARKLNSDSTANDGYVSNFALIDSLTKYTEITRLTDSLDLIRDTLAVHNTRIIARKSSSDSTANDGYVSNYALIDTLTKYSEITTLTDSLNLVRDTLVVHNTRIIARKLNIDSTALSGYVSHFALIDTLTKYTEITLLTDSLDVVRDTLAIRLDTLQAHNTRILAKADTSVVALLATVNTFAENQTFSESVYVTDSLTVADDAYAADWENSLEVATKNALFDKIETLITSPEVDPVYIADTSNIAFLDTPNTFTKAQTATNFVSSVATGTQPYAATSTTKNTNLNSDLLDGIDTTQIALLATKNTFDETINIGGEQPVYSYSKLFIQDSIADETSVGILNKSIVDGAFTTLRVFEPGTFKEPSISQVNVKAFGQNTTHTYAGLSLQRMKLVYDNTTTAYSAGLILGVTGANPLYFVTNSTLRGQFTGDGKFLIDSIPHLTTATDTILISSNDTIMYRTSSEILSDIGAASTTSYGNLSTRITTDSTNLKDNYTTTTDINTALGAKADSSLVPFLATKNTFAEIQTFTSGAILSNLTASELVATDASKNLQSLAVATYPSLTETSYVKGVTSAIQTQFGAKADTADVAILATKNTFAEDISFSKDITAASGAFTNLTDGFIPKHTSDATGLEDSPISISGSDIDLGNGTVTIDTSIIVFGSSVSSVNRFGIMFNTPTDEGYGIFKNDGAWVQPLHISFAGGIKITGGSNDIGFYTDKEMTTSILALSSSTKAATFAGDLSVATNTTTDSLLINNNAGVNVLYADSVHANWFGGSNFELGETGSDVTISADTLKGSPIWLGGAGGFVVSGSGYFSGSFQTGDGSGSPEIKINKSDAGTGNILFQKGGIDAVDIKLEADESLTLNTRAATDINFKIISSTALSIDGATRNISIDVIPHDTAPDSILTVVNDVISYRTPTELFADYSTTANLTDSLDIVRDTLAIRLDTLQSHNTRILAKADTALVPFLATKNDFAEEQTFDDDVIIDNAGDANLYFKEADVSRGKIYSATADNTFRIESVTNTLFLNAIGNQDISTGTGTTTFGAGVVATTAKLTTGATNNYVLTSDADGNGTWKAPTAGQTYLGTVDGDDGTINGTATILVDSTGTAGDYYRCIDAGTYDYGNLFPASNTIVLALGDDISYNGLKWQKIPSFGTAGTVTSVAALTLGTTGTDLSSSVATGTVTPVITLNVPTSSAANRGALSAADWTDFNAKADTVYVAMLASKNTFAEDQTVPDEVYGSGWDGSLEVPTKNAVYDKIENLFSTFQIHSPTISINAGTLVSDSPTLLVTDFNVVASLSVEVDNVCGVKLPVGVVGMCITIMNNTTWNINVVSNDYVYGVGGQEINLTQGRLGSFWCYSATGSGVWERPE